MYRGTEAGDVVGMSPQASGNRVPSPGEIHAQGIQGCMSLGEKSLRASLQCYSQSKKTETV